MADIYYIAVVAFLPIAAAMWLAFKAGIDHSSEADEAETRRDLNIW